MKKIAIFLLVTVIISPSVAFASWWNPFSWGIFHRVDKTQILENQIQELQKKLNEKINIASYLKICSILFQEELYESAS